MGRLATNQIFRNSVAGMGVALKAAEKEERSCLKKLGC
jgi:hypothetical protein